MQHLNLFTEWVLLFPLPSYFTSFSLKDNQNQFLQCLSVASLFTPPVFHQSWSPLFFFFLVLLLLSCHCGQSVLRVALMNSKHCHFSGLCYAMLAPAQSHLKSILSSVSSYFSLFPVLISNNEINAAFLYKEGKKDLIPKWEFFLRLNQKHQSAFLARN